MTFQVEGLADLLANLDAVAQKVVLGRVAAAQEICDLLAAWAKANAPFTDRTGDLRASIAAEIESVSADLVTLVLGAGTEYATYVELGHDERFAYLRPAIEANRSAMEEIVKRHCGVE